MLSTDTAWAYEFRSLFRRENHSTDMGYLKVSIDPHISHKFSSMITSFALKLMVWGLCSSLVSTAGAREWNDTGVGTIAFEEAWTLPELLSLAG